MTKVVCIATGGTIEKTYDESAGTLENHQSQLEEKILNQLRLPHTEVEVHPLLAKDSMDMTDADRDTLTRHVIEVAETVEAPILVVHGTDTMTLSMEYLASRFTPVEYPIVFTGAMRPIDMHDTDAWQNVAEALLAAKLLPPGIYLSFHNQVFPALKTHKDRSQATFVFND